MVGDSITWDQRINDCWICRFYSISDLNSESLLMLSDKEVPETKTKRYHPFQKHGTFY